jgi:hypothetical protein
MENEHDKEVELNVEATRLNMRKQIIQLSHLGWKPEQIASKVKLSVAEVELILSI